MNFIVKTYSLWNCCSVAHPSKVCYGKMWVRIFYVVCTLICLGSYILIIYLVRIRYIKVLTYYIINKKYIKANILVPFWHTFGSNYLNDYKNLSKHTQYSIKNTKVLAFVWFVLRGRENIYNIWYYIKIFFDDFKHSILCFESVQNNQLLYFFL